MDSKDNAMKQLMIAVAVVGVLGASSAQADVSFSFDPLADGANSGQVSSYMTNLNGSGVTVTDARVDQGDWNGNASSYLWTAGGSFGDMEISFDEAVSSVSFMGYIFDATRGTDFSLKAYNADYGDGGWSRYIPNPDAKVDTYNWWGGDDTQFFSGWIEFSEPVTLLVFSNSGLHDVGIDNLRIEGADIPVEPVPAPGAIVLGAIGLGFVGWMKRRLA